ncbi:MAG: hypothetical protein QXW47_05015 [Candidatus Jordarchaeales archaeon]|nr:hypothetical protein [Candidatus Jordarchaeia archaeon]
MSNQVFYLPEEAKSALILLSQMSRGERLKNIVKRLERSHRPWTCGKAEMTPEETIEWLVDRGLATMTKAGWVEITTEGRKLVQKIWIEVHKQKTT